QESYADLENKVEQRTAELSESLQQQTATSEVLGVISSSPNDLAPVFQTMLENATRVCHAKYGQLFLYENDKNAFRAVATRDVPTAWSDFLASHPLIPADPTVPLGRVAATKAVVHVPDATQEQGYLKGFPGLVAVVKLGGARTLLVVPMLKENELVGALGLYRQEVLPFTQKQIDLVTNFARQAVIAIENARLLRELRERTDDLSESLQQQTATADVLKVISRSAFDLKSVLTTLTESAKSLCGGSLGIICLRDGEVMRLRAESGCTPAFIAFMNEHPMKAGRDTITGRVFQDGSLVHVPDVRLDSEYNFGNAPTIGDYRAVLAVPLMRDGAVDGVLLLGRPTPGPFSPRQIELVQ